MNTESLLFVCIQAICIPASLNRFYLNGFPLPLYPFSANVCQLRYIHRFEAYVRVCVVSCLFDVLHLLITSLKIEHKISVHYLYLELIKTILNQEKLKIHLPFLLHRQIKKGQFYRTIGGIPNHVPKCLEESY